MLDYNTLKTLIFNGHTQQKHIENIESTLILDLNK